MLLLLSVCSPQRQGGARLPWSRGRSWAVAPMSQMCTIMFSRVCVCVFVVCIVWLFAVFDLVAPMNHFIWLAPVEPPNERVRTYVRTCVRAYVRTCVRVYVCTCVRVYVCTCVRVYVCTCVRVYACMCTCLVLLTSLRRSSGGRGILKQCLSAWLPCCLAAWLLGCLAAWLPSRWAAWLPAWLPAYTSSTSPLVSAHGRMKTAPNPSFVGLLVRNNFYA